MRVKTVGLEANICKDVMTHYWKGQLALIVNDISPAILFENF